MNTELNYLKNIINSIQDLYDESNEAWMIFKTVDNINLKKNYICDINNNDSIQLYIIFYNIFLSLLNVHLKITSQYPEIRARIKNINSISSKIEKYNTAQHEYGKIPINKCLNDLLGFRVILKNHFDYKIINDFIHNTYGDIYKCIDASKNAYKATHIYYRDKNYLFPWEFQIWNQTDEKSNIESHKLYKQDYTNWEKNIDQKEIE